MINVKEIKGLDKTCYMLIGLPGSGKSTLIKNVLGTEIAVVSSDYFIEKYAEENNVSYSEAYTALGDQPFKLLSQKVQSLIKDKESFIWDQTNIVASARRKRVRMLNQNKYNVIGIYFDIPKEELYSRLENRKLKTNKNISLKIVNKMMEDYTIPEYEEGFYKLYKVDEKSNILLIEKVMIEKLENSTVNSIKLK